MTTERERIGQSGGAPLPRGVRIRRGTVNDEFAAFDVMRRAMGYEMLWTHHAAMRRHLRVQPDSRFWVAEEGGRFGPSKLIGYAGASVREGIWALTEFFVLPGSQRQGVGRALLDACLADENPAAPPRNRLVLASHHFGANALYIRRLNCIPRLPMLLLAGSFADLRPPRDASVQIVEAESNPAPPHFPAASGVFPIPNAVSPVTLVAEPLILTPAVQSELDALDRAVLGYARPQDHAHWAEASGRTARLFRSRHTLVGYAYFDAHSSGPALAADPNWLPAMVAHIARVFGIQHPELGRGPFSPLLDHYLAIAGTNEATLRWLLDCNWRIAFHYLLMSQSPLGQLDRYVCYNPLYIL